MFVSSLVLLLYPDMFRVAHLGSILDYAKWRTISITPKLVFPSLVALMYGRFQSDPSNDE